MLRKIGINQVFRPPGQSQVKAKCNRNKNENQPIACKVEVMIATPRQSWFVMTCK